MTIKNEKLTDEELLKMTGGQAFLGSCKMDAQNLGIEIPLYNVPPIPLNS